MGDLRTVVVGHSPSHISDPAVPLVSGQTGLTLAEIAGLSVRWWSFLFDCVNLFPEAPVTQSSRTLREGAAIRLAPRVRGRRAILLGREVADAFGVERETPLVWTVSRCTWTRIECVVLPHSSPLNPWWQDPGHRAAARRILREEAARVAAEYLDGVDARTIPELVEIANYEEE